MNRRARPVQPDLLDWQAPQAYPSEAVRAATVAGRISRAVAFTLRHCGLKRQDIAARMIEGQTAADRHWSARYADWAQTLSAEELAALDQHKSGTAMNLAVRGILDRPDLLRQAAALQRALRRAVLPEATGVYRGIGEREAAFWVAKRQGELVRLDHFVPTSVLPSAAARFSHAGFLTVLLPRGLRGAAYVHSLPRRRFPNFEMLLARGMLFRVLRVEGARLILEAVIERQRGE